MDVGGEIIGWQMGSTWRTLFPTKAAVHQCSNPRNAEFAIQVAEPTEVDSKYRASVETGAMDGWEPFDTEMYGPMRFSCIDESFCVRIAIFCPLTSEGN